MDPSRKSLEDKLYMLAEGEEIGLTAAEAAVYGVDCADEYAEEEPEIMEVDHGEEE
jgi:hypothetical protein